MGKPCDLWMKMLVMNLLFANSLLSFHLTGPRVELDSQSAALGGSCRCASPPGTSGGTCYK